jgi:hypothetical protein
MTTTTVSAALVLTAPVFTNTERLALAGFLAGYSGLTRAPTSWLRQYASWCQRHHLRLFDARPADIENSPVIWKPAAVPGPPSPGGYAPSQVSTGTRSRKNS